MFVLRPSELFHLTDDRSGGRWQTLARQLKMTARSWLHRTPMQQVARVLACPELSPLSRSDPHLLLRPLRSYLWTGLAPRQRAEAFQSHFGWLRNTLGAATIEALYDSGALPIAELQLREHRLALVLEPGRGLGREGELEVHLQLDGRVLLRASASVVPASLLGAPAGALGHAALVIGSLQGTRGDAEGLKTLAGATHRSRPKALLLAALQGLAAGWQLDALLGVCSRSHVYAGYRTLSRRIAQDYDAVWLELGAQHRMEHHWLLPRTPVLRPDHEVPARKRADNRRRCELRQALFAQSQGRAQGLLSRRIEARLATCGADPRLGTRALSPSA